MASLDARALGARVSFGLSRELWLIEAGVFLNMLGYGAVLPFEIIYLHNGRGSSLGVAGLTVGTITGIAGRGTVLRRVPAGSRGRRQPRGDIRDPGHGGDRGGHR